MKRSLGVLLLPALLGLAACRDDGTGPEPAPDSLELELPPSTSDGRSFPLTVTAVGPNGERPYTRASGTVQLSVSSGSVSPASAEMHDGRATLMVQVSGASGTLTLSAELDGVAGTGALVVAAAEDRLPGDPNEPATIGIPDEPFIPRPEDYSDTHPELPGVFLSFNTMMLVFEPTTTVGEANAVLDSLAAEIVGGIPGAGELPGILFLRLPGTTHAAMVQTLARLEADARVRVAAPDILLGHTVITGPNGGTPAGWTWEVAPTGGNWGLERSRVPQMWNLNDAIRKANVTAPVTAVLDVGFENGHPDLVFKTNLSPSMRDVHGAHVAGTIGASFDNGTGIDGLNPFASMVVLGPIFSAPGTVITGRVSVGGTMISGYYDIVRSDPAIRVVNTSLGYNWHQASINSDANAAAQHVAHAHGLVLTAVQTLLAELGSLPVLVTAAGNETARNAQFASPMANAALIHDNANIIVVEAVADAPGSAGNATRSPFSNINGHVSAPGSAILSAALLGTNYASLNGTSMASPHVAGLVGYLYTLDPTLPAPTLASNPVRDLLLANAVAVAGGATPRIDAFASALAIDGVQGNDRVLRMLLDIDDGSEDGNVRRDATGAVIVQDDADGDGGAGDGSIDMSDFRRWRDWLLQLENHASLDLDGGAAHPKLDVNGDGQLGSPAAELVYPRGDFNGDGILHRTLSTTMPGFTAAVTDLDVLQHLFADPHYQVADLPGLIESADVHIDATHCLTQDSVAAVVTSIELLGTGTMLEERNHSTGQPSHLYTVGAAPGAGTGYVLKAESLDAGGQVVGTANQDTTLHLGQDVHWQPVCVSTGFLSPRDITIHVDSMRQFTAVGVEGDITWSATGGSITSTGLYTAGTTPGTFQVRAVSVDDPQVRDSTAVTVVPGPFQGTWQGEVTFSGGFTGTTPLILLLTQNGSSVTGTWSLQSGFSGNWNSSVNGNEMSFTAVLVVPADCSGSGTGTLVLVGEGLMQGGGAGAGTCEGGRSFTFSIGGVARVPPE